MGTVVDAASIAVRGWLVSGLVLTAGVATAQDVSLEGISPYFCSQLGGSASGSTCRAPYRPYTGGDACSIYNRIDDKYQPVAAWLDSITASCSAASVLEAKKRTLQSRASLRGYVSAGRDESVNDPVVNSSYRPNGASFGSGEGYFAAECAIRTCGGGYAPPVGDSPSPAVRPPNVAPAPPAMAPRPPTIPQNKPRPEPDSNRPHISDDKLKGYTFQLCNRTGDPAIYAAFIYRYRPNDRLRLLAWYKIEPNKCSEVKIRRDPQDPSALVYYYAHSRRGKWDGTDEPIQTTRCLSNDATDRYVDDPYECRSSDILRKFRGVRFRGDHTVDLTP